MAELNSVVFGHLPIAFDDRVLRPREWTVTQSVWAAELLHHTDGVCSLLELCAGAGQIGLLTLALAAPTEHRLVAVDVNPVACAFARRNAEAVGLSEQVEVREGPMDEVLDVGERFALVIADPPWVERARVPLYPEDPALAIDGGTDGLDLALQCLRLAENHLLDGGSLLLQLGTQDQVVTIASHLEKGTATLTPVDVWLQPDCGAIMHIRNESGG